MTTAIVILLAVIAACQIYRALCLRNNMERAMADCNIEVAITRTEHALILTGIEHAHKHLLNIITAIGAVERMEIQIMANIDDVQTAVADETTVVESAVVLLDKLHALLVAGQGDPVKVQAVIDLIGKNKAALASAVAANTPAEE